MYVSLDRDKDDLPYLDSDISVEERVEDLLGRMTPEEKVWQLEALTHPESLDESLKNGGAAVMSSSEGPEDLAEEYNKIQRKFIEETRLGIPAIFIEEGVHGLLGPAGTIFPIALGLGATWDSDLVSEVGSVIAEEARAIGVQKVLSPVLGVVRDPRFARSEEEFGGSPYFVSRMGVSMVKGLQGEDSEILPSDKIFATLKHFAAESFTKAARNYMARGPQLMAPVRRREVALRPFKEAIDEAGAMSVMATYAAWNGLYGHYDKEELTDRLKNKWGFKGYVVSDGDGIYIGPDDTSWRHEWYQITSQASDYKEGVERALNAGIDVDLGNTSEEDFVSTVLECVEDGSIPEERIDDAVRRVLRLKFRLGLFDKPLLDTDKAKGINRSSENLGLSLEAARESLVLLKNEEALLPLDKDLNSILVAGPNADEAWHVLGGYTDDLRGDKDPSSFPGYNGMDPTILEAIGEKVSEDTDVRYVQGTPVITSEFPYYRQVRTEDIEDEEERKSVEEGIERAVKEAEKAEVAVVVVGGKSLPHRNWGERGTIGEHAGSRSGLWLTGCQEELVEAIQESGTPTVVVVLSGRPLAITGLDEEVPSIMAAWFPGEKGGTAVADALFGDYNPGGSSPITWPKSVGQLPLNFPRKVSANPEKLESDNYLKESLYPFGHGLSYTDFEFEDLEVSPKKISKDEKVNVEVTVRNTGEREGDKVVQLYLRDCCASLEPWEKVLRGFERINLDPGEEKKVKFELNPKDLSFVNRDLERVVEPGKFEVMIGNSSEDIVLEEELFVIDS